MRRWVTVAWVAALLASPVASRADTPGGYAPIGPPATLNRVVFAQDGTMYGTVNAIAGSYQPSELDAALWRSTDGGRTWSERYRPPSGTQLAVVGVAPRDAGTVYVQEAAHRGDAVIERLDVAHGRAVPLPLDAVVGVDAAGTVYGYGWESTKARLVRCRRLADACEDLGTSSLDAVDPAAVGTLARLHVTGATPTTLDISTDGGTSWTPRNVALEGRHVVFAGPAPGTLYAFSGGSLEVSHDVGVTFSAPRPFPLGDGVIVGSRPSAFEGSGGLPTLVSGDEGATFRSVAMPIPGGVMAVDPTDPAHFLIHSTNETRQTWDGGATWSAVQDRRFGTVMLDPGTATGTGATIYAVDTNTASDPHSTWATHDLGATWTRAATPAGARSRPVVARDDPSTAYLQADTFSGGTTVVGVLGTRDGGATWTPLAAPPSLVQDNAVVDWIDPADSAHVFGLSGNESRDAGASWASAPPLGQCFLRPLADAGSATGARLACLPVSGLQPTPATASVFPGVVDAPGSPALRALVGGDLLGDVTADLTWTSALVPTGPFGPAPPYAAGLGAWPALGGSTFYAGSTLGEPDAARRHTWVRRGTGRWWRLQEHGLELRLIAVLDATHALVDLPADGEQRPLAVLDLTRPAVARPTVKPGAGGLACAVPWSAADAETAGYAWLRDGVAVPGASSPLYVPASGDRGHAIACEAVARTDFGTATVTSDAYDVPSAPAPAARARLTLKGIARPGRRLTCGASAHITWFRDGRPVKGRHARALLVRRSDRGHVLACQTRRTDGSVTRSRAVRIGGT